MLHVRELPGECKLVPLTKEVANPVVWFNEKTWTTRGPTDAFLVLVLGGTRSIGDILLMRAYR